MSHHLPPVQLPAGVARIPLPLVGSPLRHINAYVLKGDDGYILVDCGWESADVLEALQAGLRDLGIALGDVRTLIVTHFHADHYGLASTLVRLGQMRLLMHRLDWLYLDDYYRDPDGIARHTEEWLRLHGWTHQQTVGEERALDLLRRMELVAPNRFLNDGEEVRVSGTSYRVVWTPGHTSGHLCLHARDQQMLLSGDHVLDPISPNVSLWRWEDGNVLGDFLDSLRKVAALDADLVLPAHGTPFRGLQRRVSELFAHHEEREAAVVAALHGGALTAGDVARALPWTRSRRCFEDLPPSQQRIAVTETLSHLEHLRAGGTLDRTEADGHIQYGPINS